MAVNYFTFGGIKSSDYGIYISGEGVFDAPKRAVEMVSVPGRNGAIALDQGYYENITVTYPAFNFEGSMSDFRTKLANFRNAVVSKIGYQRLTDTFHPDEYRMAVFMDGVEIKPIKYNTASQFEIKFQCKPQRWLTTGETAVTIANSGDMLTNPTQYASSPLLAVKGYGDIDIGADTIKLPNTTLGNIVISNGEAWKSRTAPATETVQPGLELLNNGDTFVIDNVFAEYSVQYKIYGMDSAVFAIGYGPVTGTAVNSSGGTTIRIELEPQYLTKGTSVSDIIGNKPCTLTASTPGGSATGTPTFGLTLQYGGGDTFTIKARLQDIGSFSLRNIRFGYTMVTGNSSKSALGNPTYIDLDIGEVYGDISGITVDLNNVASLPVELPKLASGSNAITFDNTITELKVIPRWFKL